MYYFKCPMCSKEFGSETGDAQPCPACSHDCKWVRRGTAHLPPNAESPEYFSESLGVSPGQIAEAQARFPHHRFTPDGRMIIKGQKEKNRVLRDLGYLEYTRKDLKHNW